jgi:hypothetical protein
MESESTLEIRAEQGKCEAPEEFAEMYADPALYLEKISFFTRQQLQNLLTFDVCLVVSSYLPRIHNWPRMVIKSVGLQFDGVSGGPMIGKLGTFGRENQLRVIVTLSGVCSLCSERVQSECWHCRVRKVQEAAISIIEYRNLAVGFASLPRKLTQDDYCDACHSKIEQFISNGGLLHDFSFEDL